MNLAAGFSGRSNFAGRAFDQGFRDTRHHPFQILQYVMVPESDDSESVTFETRSPGGVLAGFIIIGMLAAIDFDDEPPLEAAEIDDLIADRMLAAKLCFLEAAGTKLLP